MSTKYIQSNWVKYILLLVLGVFLGWLFFGGSAQVSHEGHLHAEGQEEGTVWTCSMHPQIRQSEPGKCPICGMNLIPASGGKQAGEANLFVHEMTPEAVALSNIRTSPVQKVSGSHELHLSGKIQVNEKGIASISAKFPGRVERLYVNFTGEEVRKGQRLAQIYSPELITAQKELLEAARTKNINSVLYNAAKEKLRSWRLTEKQIESIEEKGAVQSVFDVYADVSGYVTSRLVAEGDYVGRGSTLYEIADLSKVWVVMDAYENDLAWVNKGNQLTFSVPAIPGSELTATVDFVDPVINPGTRAASVRAEVKNPDKALKPEMFVRANISASGKAQAEGLAIPKTALLWTGKRSIVYVKVPGTEMPSFEMREIVLGPQMNNLYLVENGLREGEDVVTNGVFSVDASAQLRGNYSMMNQGNGEGQMMNKPVPVHNHEINLNQQLPSGFKEEIEPLISSYLTISEALVSGDKEMADSGSKALLLAVGKIDDSALSKEGRKFWREKKAMVQLYAEKAIKSPTLEEKRENFKFLSQPMISLLDVTGANKELYVQYCPMANDNQGAYWISALKDIRNPYNPETMLACGETKKVIR